MPAWIPEPWSIVVMTLGGLIGWFARRSARAQEALAWAAKALDLLAYLLAQGKTLNAAKADAVAELVKRGAPEAVARRAVEGAAARVVQKVTN